jgi:site-specific DNA-cytosine methylase
VCAANERLLWEIAGDGYHLQAEVLNAADLGVPRRTRRFIVGVPMGKPLRQLPIANQGEHGSAGLPAASTVRTSRQVRHWPDWSQT